ncbi:MAG: sulfatase-like hydrolase/transferase [Bacteroidota bacterium]
MIRKLFTLYIFWLIFFLLFRILFILYLQSTGTEITFVDYFKCSFHGLRLDLSTASYVVAIPFLIFIMQEFSSREIFKRIINIYHLIIIPVCIILLLANMPLYHSWGTLINRRAITFAADPVEMLASLSTLMLISSIAAAGLLSLFFIRLNRLMLPDSKGPTSSKTYIKILTSLVCAACVVIGIRGGLQLIPINESNASFSSRSVLNDAAVNPLWHLANNISKSKLTDKNLYHEMPDELAKNTVASLYTGDSCNMEIFKIAKPNVVLIILESFTADVLEPLGGEKGLTPFLSSLCDSSLLFTNIYASGRRTDQALPSLFAGFPAQPDYSVMRFTEKAAALPSMPALMMDAGYHLSYYYGGETGFSNMGAYLHHNKFEKIISRDDFASGNMNSKWGAHDEFVLQRQLKDLAVEKQPFLSVLLTLTSHEPFEIPRENYFPATNEPDRFRNAVRYTDDCLKNYFSTAEKESWFANTVFILVADHGHLLPMQRDFYDVMSHRIPLVIYGGALKDEFKGRKINGTGNQNDLPVTLLKQLKIVTDQFLMSNDLLDTCRNNFAYVDMDQTLGWITDDGSFTYLHHSNKPERIKNITDTTSYKKAVAYRQQLFETFMHLGDPVQKK